jgi:hypothetical protein
MVYERMFPIEAFKEYIKIVKSHPWRNDAERIASYSEYGRLLYIYKDYPNGISPAERKTAKYRLRCKQARKFQEEYKQQLLDQDNEFKEMIKSAKKESDEVEKVKGERLTHERIVKFVEVARSKGIPEVNIQKMLDRHDPEFLENLTVVLKLRG